MLGAVQAALVSWSAAAKPCSLAAGRRQAASPMPIREGAATRRAWHNPARFDAEGDEVDPGVPLGARDLQIVRGDGCRERGTTEALCLLAVEARRDAGASWGS